MRQVRNILTAPVSSQIATVTLCSRHSILATSTNRSLKWIVAPTSSQGAQASTRGSRGVSRLSVLPSRRQLASLQGSFAIDIPHNATWESSNRDSECGPRREPKEKRRYGL